jgi:hypothetical protein
MTASVESAIMSPAALDSHSNVSSVSPVFFTSTAPITCRTRHPPPSTGRKKQKKKTHPHREAPRIVDAVLDGAIHTLKVPPHELPADAERELLPLRQRASREARKIAQVARVEERVRVILRNE